MSSSDVPLLVDRGNGGSDSALPMRSAEGVFYPPQQPDQPQPAAARTAGPYDSCVLAIFVLVMLGGIGAGVMFVLMMDNLFIGGLVGGGSLITLVVVVVFKTGGCGGCNSSSVTTFDQMKAQCVGWYNFNPSELGRFPPIPQYRGCCASCFSSPEPVRTSVVLCHNAVYYGSAYVFTEEAERGNRLRQCDLLADHLLMVFDKWTVTVQHVHAERGLHGQPVLPYGADPHAIHHRHRHPQQFGEPYYNAVLRRSRWVEHVLRVPVPHGVREQVRQWLAQGFFYGRFNSGQDEFPDPFPSPSPSPSSALIRVNLNDFAVNLGSVNVHVPSINVQANLQANVQVDNGTG